MKQIERESKKNQEQLAKEKNKNILDFLAAALQSEPSKSLNVCFICNFLEYQL